MINIGDQVRIIETSEVCKVKHIMFMKLYDAIIGNKTYILGEPAKFYKKNEIELFDNQIQREEKLNKILND